MNYQQATHCPDCFQPSSSAICPHCQFNRDEYLQKEAALHYLPLFTTLGNDYVLGRVLGEGSFAIVYAALRIEDGLALAVKEYYPQDLAKRGLDGKTVNPKSNQDFLDAWHSRFISEGELLRSCYDYPPIKSGVVRYAGLIREQNKTTYLLMERLYGQPLGNYLKPDKENPYGKIMSTSAICGWLKPLLETLQDLHGKKIYHRDISANNIFLCGADLPGFKNLEGLKAMPVLMDFGLARVGARGTLHSGTTLGTGTFIAPEQLSGGRCDQRTDLYSLGAVIYLCLHGHPPPSVEDRRQGAAFSRLQQTDEASVALHKVALACLQLEIDKRPADVAQVLKELQSCWLNPVKETKLPEKIISASVVSEQTNQNTIIQGIYEGTKIEVNRTFIIQDKMKCGALAPKMVLIPAGSFLMGSPETEERRQEYEKQHPMTIEKPFYIGQFAVTFAEYDLFCEQTKIKKRFIFFKVLPRENPDDEGWGRWQRPVINVSWFDAMAYCEWLSEQTGKSYCLPTEAQWEYACRAGTSTPFAFGETISTDQANYNGDYVYGNGKKGKYRRKTLPVGSFPANAWNLYDMHGNVGEWTCSAYVENYDGSERKCAAGNSSNNYRVIRGGSWDIYPMCLRSAMRFRNSPDGVKLNLGFRVSRM